MSREKVYVVDENDEVICEKWRDETVPSDRIRIVSIWVESDKNEVLIARRSTKLRQHPDLWGPSAAGGVTVGDSYAETAVKELSEELGLPTSNNAGELKQISKRIYGEATEGDGLRMMTVFRVKSNLEIEQFAFQEEEVSEIKWINKIDLNDEIRLNPELYLPHASAWLNI